jgi:hypothetical protein
MNTTNERLKIAKYLKALLKKSIFIALANKLIVTLESNTTELLSQNISSSPVIELTAKIPVGKFNTFKLVNVMQYNVKRLS